jgi:hypothetical protein
MRALRHGRGTYLLVVKTIWHLETPANAANATALSCTSLHLGGEREREREKERERDRERQN